MKRKRLWLVIALCIPAAMLKAADIRGVIIDKSNQEPLIGATVQIAGTTIGAITDIDGNFSLTGLDDGTYTLVASYVSYKEERVQVDTRKQEFLTIALTVDEHQLDEVTVSARKKLESEQALLMERKKASVAIENIGSKEMSIKGISTVEDGVKKLTGISIASAGQLIVRGLGDRYSTTTLNGLPIASPNPDNKLIPLDLFPTSTVKNVTVSKVYEASSFADYSGAHIDISTKEQTGADFFSFSVNAGGKFNTLGKDFYHMDRSGTLFKNNNMSASILNMPLKDFEDYSRTTNIFQTTFETSKRTSLPEFGGNIGFGKTFDLNGHGLSLLASLGISNSQQKMSDAWVRTLEATGTTVNEFMYDSYMNELKIAGLGSVSYQLRGADMLGYTFFYARNASDTYLDREGVDYEDHHLRGSHNVTHIYTLQNHQLNGKHTLGDWSLAWGGSYSKTGSDEPDRRQVMFIDEDGTLSLFKLNRQETMRYFGELDEEEWAANVSTTYAFGEANKVQFGFNYKDKSRNYSSTRFYYNLNRLNPVVTDIYHTNDYLNQANIENGTITLQRSRQPRDGYDAGNRIYAGYLSADYYPTERLLLNLGVRFEASRQWVDYAGDDGVIRHRDLDKDDFFPAANLKYQLSDVQSLRLSFSRTITRPSFIEMAPFLYQESYGAAQIRGNAELENGYNYNLDLRYELFSENQDMVSVTGYYKHLNAPIERVQTLAGGAAVHSFRNAENGLAAGVEIELRKAILQDLKVGVNGSFMYTNVKLPEGGVYTNSQRALQGASPYLVNADLTYTPRINERMMLSAALLYNLQGPRIHSVGISGLGDIKQRPQHTLNFNASLQLNERMSLKLQLNDILNQDIVFRQEVPSQNTTLEVERFKRGTSFEVGFSYTL